MKGIKYITLFHRAALLENKKGLIKLNWGLYSNSNVQNRKYYDNSAIK
jgi:hypothetical protein